METLHPLWEQRFSSRRPLPEGETQRQLLRPVYWLGNWQFACLDYYRPPNGVRDRCVRAEPFPLVLARMVERRAGSIVSIASDAGFGEFRMADYGAMKAGVLAHMQGYAPAVSVEFARKALLSDVRPTFYEVEQTVSALPPV